MGTASATGWMDLYDTAVSTHTNHPPAETPAPRPKRRKRARAKQPRVEQLYAELIKAGQVRIERRRGRPPKIIWL